MMTWWRLGRGASYRLALLLCLAVPGAALGQPVAIDSYLEGYARAVLERELGLPDASVQVSQGVISLRAEDLRGVDRDRVIRTLAGIRGVVAVNVVEAPPAAPPPGAPPPAVVGPPPSPKDGRPVVEQLATGFLKPGRLFDPLIADPRWPHFSAAWQHYLSDEGFKDVGAASFGESFSLYRWNGPFGGQTEVGIQASVFAIFDLGSDSFDLINADYFAGLTASYRLGDWQAMARIFHQSSHLGDEFLLSNRIQRQNLSYEAADLILSRYFLDGAFRAYGGGGIIMRRDPENLGRGSAHYGLEFYSPWTFAGTAIRPVAAIDLQNREENNWQTDLSLRAGLQFETVQVFGRRLLLLLEYFNGHSPNGQFYRDTIDYIGLGVHLF
jgi:hypothetical protein